MVNRRTPRFLLGFSSTKEYESTPKYTNFRYTNSYTNSSVVITSQKRQDESDYRSDGKGQEESNEGIRQGKRQNGITTRSSWALRRQYPGIRPAPSREPMFSNRPSSLRSFRVMAGVMSSSSEIWATV